MSRRIASLAATGALLLQLLATTPADAVLTPNASIFFFKAGHAMTGTLKNGVWHRVDTFAASGWTAAAATRDSLALYNKNTGKLSIGTFRGGDFRPMHTKTLLKGYTRVGSTCDSVMFYNGATGRAITATLKGGAMGPRSSYTVPEGASIVRGACKALVIWTASGWTFGSLTQGTWTPADAGGDEPPDRFAISADSFLQILSRDGGLGSWGPVSDSSWGQTGGGSTSSFGAWDMVAGTGDSVLFYLRDGIAATGILQGGDYIYTGSQDFSVGWTIIAGGR